MKNSPVCEVVYLS